MGDVLCRPAPSGSCRSRSFASTDGSSRGMSVCHATPLTTCRGQTGGQLVVKRRESNLRGGMDQRCCAGRAVFNRGSNVLRLSGEREGRRCGPAHLDLGLTPVAVRLKEGGFRLP